MFGVFAPAIKIYWFLFLGIFQSFYWFVTLIFDKLASPEDMLQKMLQITF